MDQDIPPLNPEREAAERAYKLKKRAAYEARKLARGQPARIVLTADEKQARKRAAKSTPAAKKAKHASEHRRRIKRRLERPFTGVDGEGCGVDGQGRQHYMLLRAGDRELFTGLPLTTRQCLDFLLDCPASDETHLVGFSFGYDVTMILRDLPGVRDPERPNDRCAREKLVADKTDGNMGYTWWKGYGIDYLPKNYIRICRAMFDRVRGCMVAVPGSSRTIYETFGFFQCSFVKALVGFGIGLEHQEHIERMKERRGAFEAITPEVRRYCELECDLLAQLMDRFRTICLVSDPPLRPRTWNGAGKLAGALLHLHEIMTTAQLDQRMIETESQDLLLTALAAYYGGRFEVTRTGAVNGPVYEYDIRSAYPAAMLSLPCLDHGVWKRVSRDWLRTAPVDALFVAPLRFDHPPTQAADRRNLCGFPIRQRDGKLCWPIAGNGIYWSTEICAAGKLGAVVSYANAGGWAYEKRCECCPFSWVRGLYDYRRTLPELEGKALKLAINAIYGRLAQRIGNPRWANMIWASLITASTRAALIEAASCDPASVLMLATDGLYSTARLDVSEGEGLGQWEVDTLPGIFIVQPGLYWPRPIDPLPPLFPGKRPKSRGVSISIFAEHIGRFESAWWDWMEVQRAAGQAGYTAPPVVRVPITLFIGLRLAQARGRPEAAGVWRTDPRVFKFNWSGKRGRHSLEANHVWTYPMTGGRSVYSMPHGKDEELATLMDLARADLEEQPDHVDLSPPWTD